MSFEEIGAEVDVESIPDALRDQQRLVKMVRDALRTGDEKLVVATIRALGFSEDDPEIAAALAAWRQTRGRSRGPVPQHRDGRGVLWARAAKAASKGFSRACRRLDHQDWSS